LRRKIKKESLNCFKMANAILKCKECMEYTMEKNCPKCKGEAVSVVPAKFSPEDKYGKYRRAQKQKELEEKELL
tara:strand:- start:3073 stop:3294 length:222 start_codon:yes stop_codon:yes gene_type:complete